MSIGKKILALRKRLNLSQEEMAKALHVSRQTISKWESDLSLPDMKTILLIGEIYQVNISELLGIDETQKDDSITHLYEQVNLVNKNLEKEHKRRTVFDIVLISICVLCLCFTMFTLFAVYMKKNGTIVNNYHENIYQENEISWYKEMDIKEKSYDLDQLTIGVEIYCNVDYQYNDCTMECIFEDGQGKVYKYEMKCTKDNNRYEYIGNIPLKNYDKISMVMKCGEKTFSQDMAITSYMDEIISQMVTIFIPMETGKIHYSDREYHELNMKKIIYHCDGKWRVEGIEVKGKLKGNLSLKISGSKNDEYYVDEVIPLNKDRTFHLKKSLSQLEDVYVDGELEIDGVKYNIYQKTKVVQYYGTLADLLLY